MEAFLSLLSFDQIFNLFTELFEHDLAKFTLLFFLATKLHERAVRKENSLLRGSIDHLAEVLGRRLDEIDVRVGALEKLKKKG